MQVSGNKQLEVMVERHQHQELSVTVEANEGWDVFTVVGAEIPTSHQAVCSYLHICTVI
jgi:hypothetical protein